jgi:ribosomal protein S12 methylthiotransferase
MELQQEISADLLAARIGKTAEIIVDNVDAEGIIARSAWDAPEIDGNVYLDADSGLKVGDRAVATIEASSEYDLWGSIVPTSKTRRR